MKYAEDSQKLSGRRSACLVEIVSMMFS